MQIWYIFIPFIGAVTGLLINNLFIYILFHPHSKVKFAGMKFQGILPSIQFSAATALGRYVGKELFPFEKISEKISSPESVAKILPLAEVQIDHFLRIKLAEQMPMISMFIGDNTIKQLKTVFMKELGELFPELIKQYVSGLQSDLDPEKLITAKIRELDLTQTENMIRKQFSKLILMFRIAGILTGFITGSVAVCILLIAH